MKKENFQNSEIKPDLKHDTMEYAASTEGEDILDMDTESRDEVEEEDITADELQELETGNPDDEAFALDSVETDRTADNDVDFLENDPDEDIAEKEDE